jgi:hypothetical protein
VSSEYEPLFNSSPTGRDDLGAARDLFSRASGPYLRFPWSWLSWAIILPTAALLTPGLAVSRGVSGVLFAWSFAILLGGAIEISGIRRAARGVGSSTLASWALRLQGNLSLVAVALSVVLIWEDEAWLLPAVWLLLLGHSFYVLGGLAFAPFRGYGLILELGGLCALWPRGAPLTAFAVSTCIGNLWMAYAVWKREAASSSEPEG